MGKLTCDGGDIIARDDDDCGCTHCNGSGVEGDGGSSTKRRLGKVFFGSGMHWMNSLPSSYLKLGGMLASRPHCKNKTLDNCSITV